MSIRISGQVHMENYNTSVKKLGMCMICMLFPLCNPGRPPLLHDLLIQTSELAVDEDGIESDGVSFGLGKTDSTCWSALGSTRAFKIFHLLRNSELYFRNYTENSKFLKLNSIENYPLYGIYKISVYHIVRIYCGSSNFVNCAIWNTLAKSKLHTLLVYVFCSGCNIQKFFHRIFKPGACLIS